MIHFDITHTNERLEQLNIPSDSIREILVVSLDELKKTGEAFEEAAASFRFPEIKSAAHKIRGMAVTVGLERLAVLTGRFETMKQAGPETPELTRETSEEIILVTKLIEDYLH
ncbi:Hpt domain-containing protein [Chitinophaga sp. 212800010-3]|uniref:Hpt domain-containing protein n=1 Tax=unclassified Chitinophaga TaxID=2619133 RepID=UPI002DE8CE02|nr:hypothetical protein [Chitinophaga sp. 212800010-3]